MKRQILCLSAIAAVMALGACSGKHSEGSCSSASKCGDDKVYTGVLPGADVQGIRYTLLLDFDDDEPEGDYDMVQTYFNTDSTGTVQDVASFFDKGDFTVGTAPSGKKYLKLAGTGNSFTYFLVDTDSTLVMTGEDLTPPVTPGYTLKYVK